MKDFFQSHPACISSSKRIFSLETSARSSSVAALASPTLRSSSSTAPLSLADTSRSCLSTETCPRNFSTASDRFSFLILSSFCLPMSSHTWSWRRLLSMTAVWV